MLSNYMKAKIRKALETEHDEMIVAENVDVSHSLVASVSMAPRRTPKIKTNITIVPKSMLAKKVAMELGLPIIDTTLQKRPLPKDMNAKATRTTSNATC